MKTSLLRPILLGFFVITFVLAACGNGSPTSVIPIPPSSEWFAQQGYPSPEIPRISSQQLKQMMDNGEPLIVIDNRPEYKFNNGHIPQSINLPDELEAEQIAGFLILPKDRPIILYC